jgi:alcohol dehydrogenase class IV
MMSKQPLTALAQAVRNLMRAIGLPLTLQEAGVSAAEFEAALPHMVAKTDIDANTMMSSRIPETEEIEKLLRCAYTGAPVDF